MGYQLAINVNCEKAVDFADVAGVSLLVYHEGENFSISTLTSDSAGWAFDNIDRSHWEQTDTQRVKVYFEKAGYLKGCVQAYYAGSFTDGNNVKHHSYEAVILLVEAEPEALPPPVIEPQPPPPPLNP